MPLEIFLKKHSIPYERTNKTRCLIANIACRIGVKNATKAMKTCQIDFLYLYEIGLD